jgi:hypothetical protein
MVGAAVFMASTGLLCIVAAFFVRYNYKRKK